GPGWSQSTPHPKSAQMQSAAPRRTNWPNECRSIARAISLRQQPMSSDRACAERCPKAVPLEPRSRCDGSTGSNLTTTHSPQSKDHGLQKAGAGKSQAEGDDQPSGSATHDNLRRSWAIAYNEAR